MSRSLVLLLCLISLTACGGGGGGGGSAAGPAAPAQSNVLAVSVDAGPAGSGYNVNRLYATVVVCVPGTSDCRTIDHVLVDTGSTGLRLLSSAISPALSLSRLTGGTGLPLLSCAQFVDNSFVWGPVATADVVLGGKTAASVPIQVVADPAFAIPAAACAAGGTAMNSVATLGAKGILGLGLFKEDCGAGCTGNASNGFYYTCTDFTCTATVGATASIAKQLKNPVPLFASDNNGVLIDLPAVASTTASSLNGSMIFGIGTQANNQFVPGSVLTSNSSGYFSSVFAGQNLGNSFIDTGSNGLFFDSGAIPLCVYPAVGFYCPFLPTNLSATLVGTNAVTVPISFVVDNGVALAGNYPHAVLPALAGPIGDASIFDWGLPFFYGRKVFVGIQGQSSVLGTGPFYAF